MNLLMRRFRKYSTGLAITAAVAAGYAFQGTKPWPPGLQQVSNESRVLSPQEELKTFFMPPGYHLELVASEPMIEEPILIDWDADGRLWDEADRQRGDERGAGSELEVASGSGR